MATITEDYVSFEIAKLLKEKKFNEETRGYYPIKGDATGKLMFGSEYPHNNSQVQISAPTLQMAMKWLRVEHNLSVEVYRTSCGYIGCIVKIPSGTDIKFLEEDGDDLSSGQYTKWEYACEAAIKYCLEHLI